MRALETGCSFNMVFPTDSLDPRQESITQQSDVSWLWYFLIYSFSSAGANSKSRFLIETIDVIGLALVVFHPFPMDKETR
jgi:hypothetical protein